MELDRLLRRQIREVVAPISKEGVEAIAISSQGSGGHVSAAEFQDREQERPEEFTPSTVIISGGWAVWEVEVPEEVRQNLVDMTLRIETIRTHGMLHSPDPDRSAAVFVNDQLVDKIYLVKLHPHGTHYGIDSRRPFPIFRYVDRTKGIQTIKVSADTNVFWDIDQVSLEPIILRKELRPEAAMLMGALISAIIGIVAALLMELYNTPSLP